jgi:hypothetical protein
MTVIEKYNYAVDTVEGDDSLFVGYVSDIESYVPVVVDLLDCYNNLFSLLGSVEKKRINLYYFNGELVSNFFLLGSLLREVGIERESCLSMLDEIYLYCLPALRFEVKILSNDVSLFVSIMKGLKDLRYSVVEGVLPVVEIVEEPVVQSVERVVEVLLDEVVEEVVKKKK